MGALMTLVVLVIAGVGCLLAASRAGSMRDYKGDRERRVLGLMGGGSLALAVVVAVSRCVVVIPPGSVAVPIVFGKVQDRPLQDGLHFVPPWVHLEVLNARTQSYTMSQVSDEGIKTGDDSIKVLTANGMEMRLDVTVTYRLRPEAAPWVFRNLGSDFEDRIIRAGVRTAIREAVSGFTEEEVYGAKRDILADAMQSRLDESLQRTIRGDYSDAPAKVFSVSNVLVRNIELPKAVTEGINRKLVMKQESERMEFEIARDRQEADRKVIEAKGIRDSQEIIANGITPDFLTWKAIEATEMLTRSPNAKIVIIGNSKNGLPIMLDSGVPSSPGALTPEEIERGGRRGAPLGTNRPG